MITLVVVLAIGIYAGYVIRRQILNWKSGKFCSCNCSGCSSACQKNVNNLKKYKKM